MTTKGNWESSLILSITVRKEIKRVSSGIHNWVYERDSGAEKENSDKQ